MKSQITLGILGLFVGISAVLSGLAMIIAPDGSLLGMEVAMLGHSPFDSYLVPGLILAVVVGGTALAAGIGHARRRGSAYMTSLVAGALLAGWVLVQVLLVRDLHWLQGVYLVVGLGQVMLAATVLGRAAPQPDDHRARLFLTHNTIALVGLSTKETAFSKTVGDMLTKQGHRVIAVNPRRASRDEPGVFGHVV